MDLKEAVKLVNEIKPKITVPTHYGSIVGTKQDGVEFIKLLSPEVQGEILLNQ